MATQFPNDLTAERYVLAAGIESGGATLTTGELRAEDFHLPAHGALFAALCHRRDAGEPVEPSSVLTDLNAIPGLDASWLADLLRIGAVPASVDYYAEIVRARAIARAIIAAGNRAVQIGEQAVDEADLAEAANAACQAITDAMHRGASVDDVAADLEAVLDHLDSPDEYTPTPWPDLDRFIGGWTPGGLYVIGARPGVGKSLLGVCAALHAASRGRRVFFASVEMAKRELYLRMLANVGKVDHSNLVRKRLDDDAWRRVVKARSEIGEMPLHVADDLTRLAEIITRAASITRDHGPLGLVVVDYLQLMADDRGRDTTRQEQVAGFSRSLKLAAKTLHVPILALSQLNRRADEREQPRMSDLRESGALEQDADVVLLLHRDPDQPDLLGAAVAKNRHGIGGGLDFFFGGRYQRIESLDARSER